jgi:multicomponent Na+:H+ antiporter subunit D
VLFFRIIEIAFFQPPAEVKVREAPALILQPLVITAVALIVIGLYTGPIVSGLIGPALPWRF